MRWFKQQPQPKDSFEEHPLRTDEVMPSSFAKTIRYLCARAVRDQKELDIEEPRLLITPETWRRICEDAYLRLDLRFENSYYSRERCQLYRVHLIVEQDYSESLAEWDTHKRSVEEGWYISAFTGQPYDPEWIGGPKRHG